MEDSSAHREYNQWLNRPKEEAHIFVRLRIVTSFNIYRPRKDFFLQHVSLMKIKLKIVEVNKYAIRI